VNYTAEQLQVGLKKAEEAGDTAAANELRAALDKVKAPASSQNPYINGFQKAAAAGDIASADEIASKYRQTREGWSRESALKDPMWVQNAKILHKEVEGKDAESDEKAADWLKSHMSDFNYRLIGLDGSGARGTLDIAAKVKNLSPKGKAAFLASMDDFDNLPWLSMEGFKAAMGRGFTDPTNLIGAGTFGAGLAAKQAAAQATKKGIKEVLKRYVGRGAATAGIENTISSAAEDVGRQATERAAGRTDSFDVKRLAKQAAIGGAVGAGLGAAGGALVGARPIARAANKLEVVDEEAAGRVAQRIADLEREGLNPKDVRSSAPDGATTIIKKMQKDLHTEIKLHRNILKQHFDPKSSDAHPRTLELAIKALDNVMNDQKGTATRKEIKAVESLVGHTREGQRLVQLIQEKVEVQRMDRRGAKGGVSKFTDELDPFAGDNSRLGATARSLRTAASAAAIYPTGGLNLAAQYGAVAGGRVVDALTGRRALVKLFKDQNLGKAVNRTTDHLPSQIDIDTRTRLLARDIKREIKEEEKFAREQARTQKQADREQVRLDKQQEREARRAEAQQVRELKQEQIRSARAAKIAEKEAANRRKAEEAAARKQEADQQKAERDKFKMLRNAAIGVEKLKKQAEADKAAATKPNTKAVDNTPKDAAGRKIKSVKLYNARKGEIVALEQGAKQKAAKAKDPEVKKIIEDAVTLFNTEGRGRQTHKRRIEIFKEAVAKAQSLEQREAVKEALKPLAEVYGKVD
jgi:hypothetical protein